MNGSQWAKIGASRGSRRLF